MNQFPKKQARSVRPDLSAYSIDKLLDQAVRSLLAGNYKASMSYHRRVRELLIKKELQDGSARENEEAS